MICSRMLIGIFCFSSVSLVYSEDRRGPFTHESRSVRSRDIDQQHVRLELTFDCDQQQIVGRAILKLSCYRSLNTVKLDAADMKINRVILLDSDNEAALKFRVARRRLIISLGREYGAGQTIELAIDYVISRPTRGAHFVVPDESEPNQPRMVWTQSEPEYARYWFPCVDSPADRLTSEILATVPANFVTLSNGILKSKTKNDDGTQTWHWVQRKTHVTYLLSIVAGEFEVYEQTWDGIPIKSYVPKGQLAHAARSFEKTAAMMDFYSNKFGVRYPWPKYSQICVDEYNWGGMEHTSATTLNVSTLHDERAHLDRSSDGLVAHELVHQWHGDLMTCKDWAELWLNESFATYFQNTWTEHDKGWDEATWEGRSQAKSYLAEDKRYRRPIVSYRYNRPGNMFDRHSYPKGARVLHMLRFELGDELFWRAIQKYTRDNQYRSVETADFRMAIERATGQGMNWFFDQWIHHGGHPDFEVAWDWDSKAHTVRITVKQTQKVDEMTPLFRTSAEIEFVMPEKTVTRRVSFSKAEQTFHFQLAQRPTRVCFDPNNWILKTLKFEKDKDELLDQIANDEHIICRARAAEQLAGFTKHEDVRDALLHVAKHDAFWGVRQTAVQSLAKFKGDVVRNGLVQSAAEDKKSFVRREAIKSLGNFSHDQTRKTLRQIVDKDHSYHAIAEALRTLVKVDAKNCSNDLLAALSQSSDRDEILKSACDGLVKLKSGVAEERLRELLDAKTPITPQRRVILIGALARLKPDDEAISKLLHKQLDNERRHVRQAAVNALKAIGGSTSVAVLQARRNKEESTRMIEAIDSAIAEIQKKQSDSARLRKEVDTLRKKNQSLADRIDKLENKQP